MAKCIDCSYCILKESSGLKPNWICTRDNRNKRITGDEETCRHFTKGDIHNCFECVHASADAFRSGDTYFCKKKFPPKRIHGQDVACSDFIED